MKIIEPSATIANPLTKEEGIGLLRQIEYYGRISHRTEDKQTDTSYIRFLEEVVMKHGDWSIVEHGYASVIFRVSRGVTHELVRHRLFSYTQESTRFVRYGGKQVPELEFIRPSHLCTDPLNFWDKSIQQAEESYNNLLYYGWKPQEARSVLPNALAATIAMSGNLRSWRWFFLARSTQETHPDMKQVTIPLLQQFQERIPIIYSDIEPNQKQSISAAKPH